jgi:hypothetical protein
VKLSCRTILVATCAYILVQSTNAKLRAESSPIWRRAIEPAMYTSKKKHWKIFCKSLSSQNIFEILFLFRTLISSKFVNKSKFSNQIEHKHFLSVSVRFNSSSSKTFHRLSRFFIFLSGKNYSIRK